MSLLSESMEKCTTLTRTSEPDGRGGFIVTWKDGTSIDAAITYDSSIEARTAEAQGVKALYTVTTEKKTTLLFHDVIRRESDKKIFRITSDGNDNKTPASAGLNMRQVSAEEWALDGQMASTI